MANGASESLDHACSALANLVARVVSLVSRIAFLAEECRPSFVIR
jgi:hypothetical protein